MRKVVLILCLILFPLNIWASEKLLYAIRSESLRRYPDIVYTKIYSLNPDGGNSPLIFSDENAPMMLLPKRGMPGHPGEVLVSGKNGIFAHAVEKSLNPGRWYSSKASIYELSSDSSNNLRKIFNVEGEQSLSEMFVNSTGTKIGYVNYLNQKTFIFIHETGTGNLLHKIEMSKVFLNCFASAIGWLRDGNRLFFTLDTGDVHMTSEESYKNVGTYFMKEDGMDLVRLPQELFSFPEKKGFGTHSSAPQLIGELPDGTYLFREFKFWKDYRGAETCSLIYRMNPRTKSKKEIPLKVSEGLSGFRISPAGRYMGFAEKISSKEGRYEWSEHIWVKDLATEEDKKVFTLDNMPFKGFYLGLFGWREN